MKTLLHLFRLARVPILAAVLGFSGLAAPAVHAETAAVSEYDMKAVQLFNFVQNTEWPATAFVSSNAPIRIGIIGNDDFAATVGKAVANESVHGRKIVVETAKRIEELKDCSVVFVSKTERQRAAQILTACGTEPVLTVGEFDGFGTRGGVFNFFIKDGTVKLEINLGAARLHNLKVAPQWIELGRRVETKIEKEKP